MRLHGEVQINMADAPLTRQMSSTPMAGVHLDVWTNHQRIRDLMKSRFFYRKFDLVKEINAVKTYPMVQINAALNQLVEDKNEYIADMYDRTGRMVNIGDLYMFQPLELNNKHVSIYDRSTPLDFKRPKLDFNLPGAVDELVQPGPKAAANEMMSC